MAATYRASFTGGDTAGTSDRTVTITPAVGDLIVVFVALAGNVATLEMTDDNGVDGTYTRIASALWATSVNNAAVFVRNALIRNTDSTIITCASGSNTAGALVAVAVSGMLRTGLSAIRSYGLQQNQASGGTPTPVLNQSALNTNLTMTAVASADTTSTPNASWTERQDTSQATPTTALEVATRDSGFSGSSIAYGATQSADFASFAIELDGSAASVPQLQAVLESYFETGDKPGETQFREFIGTLFALYVDAKTTANEAAADAAEAQSHVPLAMVAAHYVSGTTYTIDSSDNVASVDIPNSLPFTIKVNFTAPMPDADFIVSITSTALDQSNLIRITAKDPAYIQFIMGSGSGLRNVGQAFEMIVYHP